MTKAFEPFRKVDPEVLDNLGERMLALDMEDIVVVTMENGEINATNDKFWAYHGDVLRDSLTSNSAYTAVLLNVTILLNTYDESKIVVHPKHEQPSLDDASPLDDFSRTQSWSRMTVSCPDEPSVKNVDVTMGRNTTGFVSNLTESQDICQHFEYQKLHSFFNTPESLRLTDLPLPLFSQAKPSSFQDLLYPSPFYEAHRSDYEADDDLSWDSIYTGLYWRGSTTGGHSTLENWHDMHR
ncbi:unnamed protein product [Aureobasidium vineae]|uniref:Uncharacterized protein n=1 Tax=Aureobasidium vineae TaxID=2773715 RepID=A0A9N8JQC1_9PEZI|nr:unnamed protein product [Aureobasidium vineae]